MWSPVCVPDGRSHRACIPRFRERPIAPTWMGGAFGDECMTILIAAGRVCRRPL